MSSEHQPRAAAIGIGINEMTLGLLGAAVLLYGAVLWCARGPNVEKTDFSLTYVGAQIVHQGLGSRLYELDLQKQVRDSLFQHPNPLFFEHPPFEALLLSALDLPGKNSADSKKQRSFALPDSVAQWRQRRGVLLRHLPISQGKPGCKV